MVVVVDESHGVSLSHDSAVALNPSKSMQPHVDDEQRLTNSKKFTATEETLAGVVVITEEIPTATPTQLAVAGANKSYLRRLGDYLNRRRAVRTNSGTAAAEAPAEDLPNVIYSDSADEEEEEVDNVDAQEGQKVMKQGNFVIKEPKASFSLSSTASDISDLDLEGIVRQKKEMAETPNGYLLPRVFLNKDG